MSWDWNPFNNVADCYQTDDLSVHMYNAVNIWEGKCRPPTKISGNVVNKDAPDARNGEQLAVVLLNLLLQLVLLEFLCDVGVRKRLVSVNHFRRQHVFFCLLEKDAHTWIHKHVFVLVSPQICSYQTASSERWEHLVDQMNQMAPVESSRWGASKHLDGVWTLNSFCVPKNIWLWLYVRLSVCVCVGVYEADVLIREKKKKEKKNTSQASADFQQGRGSKRFLTGSMIIYELFPMCFISVHLHFTSEALSQFKNLHWTYLIPFYTRRAVALIGRRRLWFKTWGRTDMTAMEIAR